MMGPKRKGGSSDWLLLPHHGDGMGAVHPEAWVAEACDGVTGSLTVLNFDARFASRIRKRGTKKSFLEKNGTEI
ncbi:hypothetical protein ACP70R_033486 [Stipagrostis hirtigluma subsp. patula]